MMNDQDIATAAVQRKSQRLRELYPNHTGHAYAWACNGVEIPAPYVGGEREAWSPSPGAEYTEAVIEDDGSIHVYRLRQPE